MNVALMYAETIKNFNKIKCGQSSSVDCIHDMFDGEEYFDEFIMNPSLSLEPLFGDKNRLIRLDKCGDSTPRYAIYQIQGNKLEYKVSIKIIIFSTLLHCSCNSCRKLAHGH